MVPRKTHNRNPETKPDTKSVADELFRRFAPTKLPFTPVADASEATIKKSVVDKMLESVRKQADAKGYRRGYRKGRIVGFSAGFDAGAKNVRDNFGRYNP
jgi:hypothetical protein